MSYSKLRGRIREKFGTQSAFAKAINMNPSTLSAKLNGGAEWTRPEMEAAAKVLDFPPEEMGAYFFSH